MVYARSKAKKLRCLVVFKQYLEKIAIIAATSRPVLTVNRANLEFTVILPNPKELQINFKVSWSSKCNSITKLNEKTLPLPLVIKKHPSASVKPLNHSMKLRDKTSFRVTQRLHRIDLYYL